MKRLKLCMVTTFYPPYSFGGDGVFVYRLVNAVARAGHEVHVVHDVDAFAALGGHVNGNSAAYGNHPNVTLHPLSRGSAGRLDLLMTHQLGQPVLKRAEIRSLLAGSGFDVIHYHNISLMGGPRVLTYGDALKLCTLHEYWLICPMHVLWRMDREACTRRTCFTCTLAGHRPPQLWRYGGSVERAARQVDAFIAPSRFTRDMYVRQGFTAPIRRLPHFVPDDESQATAGEEEVGTLAPARPYFLYAGRLERLKGPQVLVEQFKTYRAADLVIVGTGTQEAELRRMAEGLPHVHFLGSIPHHRLKALYRGAIAAIAPSLCYETFGLVPIEAFAAHTPAIVSGTGALAEVVESGGGLVYRTNAELVQAMETLRTQPELRDRLGEEGYQSYIAHYTEEQHLAQYFSLIEELQSKRTQGAPR